jgi:hypothetical protein
VIQCPRVYLLHGRRTCLAPTCSPYREIAMLERMYLPAR